MKRFASVTYCNAYWHHMWQNQKESYQYNCICIHRSTLKTIKFCKQLNGTAFKMIHGNFPSTHICFNRKWKWSCSQLHMSNIEDATMFGHKLLSYNWTNCKFEFCIRMYVQYKWYISDPVGEFYLSVRMMGWISCWSLILDKIVRERSAMCKICDQWWKLPLLLTLG